MKKKKTLSILLVLLLAAALCVCVSIYRRDGEQAKQEQKEKKPKITEAQEQLKAQQATPEETISVSEEDTDTGLEEEAQIENPAGTNDHEQGTEGMEDLKAQLGSMVSSYEGDWSIYVSDLSSGEYLEINSHPVKAASLIKLYIMGAVLEQIGAGNLTEDENIDRLLSDMIIVSDNESSNELVRLLSPDGTDHAAGMEVVNAFANTYGYQDTSQGRDLKDVRDTPPPGENFTSVRDCGLFLKRVYAGECVSAEASAKMLELLKQQTRTWKIPAGVPDGVVTANKTGELSDTENDVAIVFSPGGNYILCVTSTDLTDTSAAQANIVSISDTVYQYMEN